MTASVALTSVLHRELTYHLLARPGEEEMCFALWSPSDGATRSSALVGSAIWPQPGERNLHGNVSFNAQYVERCLGHAASANRGLAVLHSHVGPGWQELSTDDRRAESGLAGAVRAATGLPLVGLTLGTDGTWSARSWHRASARQYVPDWCETVRVVGDQLSISFAPHLRPVPEFRTELQRTVSAWGPRVQANLMRLRVGVVGCGSVGSIVAEALARMGVGHMLLLDFDTLEYVNLDRCLHGTREDVVAGRSKVEALARGLSRSATAAGFEVKPLEYSVIEGAGFRAALDCDLLFCCVDRPWPRSVLNGIAYAHLIPVIDGGVLVTTRAGGTALRGADWRAHTVAPGRRCMECLGQYTPADVSLEREGHLDDPRYIAGLPVDDRLRRNENVFAFSLSVASMEILQALALVVAPAGVANIGAKLYHFVNGREEEPDLRPCKETCAYPPLVATGERAGVIWVARHKAAGLARQRRAALQRMPWTRIRRWLGALSEWLFCRTLNARTLVKRPRRATATQDGRADDHQAGGSPL
jgi:molybdopterin-synthase adenylyltransferase